MFSYEAIATVVLSVVVTFICLFCRNAYEEAMIAFGGPVVGTAAALGTLGVI